MPLKSLNDKKFDLFNSARKIFNHYFLVLIGTLIEILALLIFIS